MKWIWLDLNGDNINTYCEFKNFFILPINSYGPEQSRAVMRICADSQYVLFVNGRYAASGQYADYPFAKVYDEINITEYIINGENRLDFLIYHQGVSTAVYRRGEPGFCYTLEYNGAIISESSAETLGRLSPCYRSGRMEQISNEIGFAFEYDASKDDSNASFLPPHESDTKFYFTDFPIKERQGYVPLCPRPIKKLKICEPKSAKLITQGLFKLNKSESGDVTAIKLQRASLSQRFIREITDIKKRVVPCLDGNNSVHFVHEDTSEFDGIYAVIDLLEETAGYFHLDIDAPAGTRLYIAYGEHLVDLRVRSGIGGRCFTGVYTCKGGRQEFTYYIHRMGLRYIQIYVETFDFTLYHSSVKSAEYPVTDICRFKSSDLLHNRIYETGVRTLRLCMHEHYEDCPWREQALYSMDSRNQILAGYYAFGEYDMPKASIRLLGQGMREDGMLELNAPSEFCITIPSFSLIWITELYEYVLYSGDIEFAEEEFPVVIRLLETFAEKALRNGLLTSWKGDGYWNFYEWAEWMAGSVAAPYEIDADATLTLFYLLALKGAMELGRLISANDKRYLSYCDKYESTLDSVKHEFNRVFWDKEHKAYASYIINGEQILFSELTNALALYTGVVPDEYKIRIANLLTGSEKIRFEDYEKLPGSPKYFIPTTLSHSIYKYEALLTVGSKYSDYVLSDIADKYGYMLYNSATSFWECIDGASAFDNAGSLCHGWSAIPVVIYGKYVLGVYPVKPGFKKYEFKPLITPLTRASGDINMSGNIMSVTIGDACTIKRKENKQMEQLSMVFHGKEVSRYPLPEGFSVEYYSGKPEQVEDWINICKEGVGLLTDDPHRDFNDFILNMEGLKPEEDLIFIVSPSGVRAATIAFFAKPDGVGLLHMICCSEKYRGLGIGNGMVSYALSQLIGRGIYETTLKTDDFRLPAIRSYLKFGFEPLLTHDGMEERWKKIFEVIKEHKK